MLINILQNVLEALETVMGQTMPADIASKLSEARRLIAEVREYYVTNEEHPTVIDNEPPSCRENGCTDDGSGWCLHCGYDLSPP